MQLQKTAAQTQFNTNNQRLFWKGITMAKEITKEEMDRHLAVREALAKRQQEKMEAERKKYDAKN